NSARGSSGSPTPHDTVSTHQIYCTSDWHDVHCDNVVYYQVFSPSGIIPSKSSFSKDDPATGRVIASHITPPQTVRSIKMFLCKEEGISDIHSIDLFASAVTSRSPLSEREFLDILSPDGPGSAAHNPMALVTNDLPLADSGNLLVSVVLDPAHSS